MSGHGSTATTLRGSKAGAFSAAFERSVVLVAAILAVGVALVVVVSIIPSVRNIWLPQSAQSDLAIPAFRASAAANLMFASVLVAVTVLGGMRHRILPWVLVILAAGALLQALMYLDAAAAFHGPLQAEMQPTATRLRYAAVADAVAGLLVLAGTIRTLRTRRAGAGHGV